MGNKNRPAYRFVVADSRERRDGAFIEMIGNYDPLTEPATISVKEESLYKWMDRGAQLSETVRSLLKKEGILDKSGKKPKDGVPGPRPAPKPAPKPAAAAETPVESPAEPAEAPAEQPAAESGPEPAGEATETPSEEK
jgi:small subunit ribosomal protein S16